MNKKQIIKLFFDHSIKPTRGEKLLMILLLFCAVGYGAAGFATIVNPFAFGWLVYASQVAILVVEIAVIVLHVRNVIKQIKASEC